jgi:group I intron endonuclease
MSCIYRIVVTRFGQPELYYIGQAKIFDRRKREHLKAARKGRHDNRRLQNLFWKYGSDAFRFEQIVVCSSENATMYEQAILDFYIGIFKSRIINICRQCVTSAAGIRHSVESRANMSAAKKGKPGRRWTDEQKAKVSATKKGKPRKLETIEAHRKAITGKKFTAETRQKMSVAAKGRRLSLETRAKMSASALLRARKPHLPLAESAMKSSA